MLLPGIQFLHARTRTALVHVRDFAAFRTNDCRPQHDQTQAPPAPKRTRAPATRQNARSNSSSAPHLTRPPPHRLPSARPSSAPQAKARSRPYPTGPYPSHSGHPDNPRPQTRPCLAVRPRCARAPGSPRHLLHHPPVYAKILTAPSTQPLTSLHRHATLLGPMSCRAGAVPSPQPHPASAKRTQAPHHPSLRPHPLSARTISRPCPNEPKPPPPRKMHERIPPPPRPNPVTHAHPMAILASRPTVCQIALPPGTPPQPRRRPEPGDSPPSHTPAMHATPTSPAPTHPCLAVRPRCARAPGSPRHLVHHSPVYPKILTAPSMAGVRSLSPARPCRHALDATLGSIYLKIRHIEILYGTSCIIDIQAAGASGAMRGTSGATAPGTDRPGGAGGAAGGCWTMATCAC